jgi:hypothetical protein
MSTITMPAPSDVAATTSEAVLSLSDEQIVAIIDSSRKIQRRVLPNCWDTVRAAAPDLALALDELHSTAAPKDLPRFEALAAAHRKQLDKAVKSPAGKTTATLLIAAVALGIVTAVLGLTGDAGLPFVIGGAGLAAALLTGAYAAGSRLAHRSGNWLVSDPEATASIVWDAGIDAAAATALKARAGQDGLTPDILRALSLVWTRAGLDTGKLTPQIA